MSEAREVLVTMRDVRAVHMCSRGTRAFFERHALDYAHFLRNGVSSRVLEATGDAMARQVVEVVRGRK